MLNSTVPRVFQKPTPRNLRPLPGFRRDGTQRRKWVPKALQGCVLFRPSASLGELMSWVLALKPRRGDGKAWTDDEQATVNELNMRAWRDCDLKKRRGFVFPTWLTRKLAHPRYWPFLSMLNSAYRAGTPGVLWSYREMCVWLGMSLRQTFRWIDRLEGLGVISVVGTCVAASSKGRRRDDGMNLYMLGPAVFDKVRSAPLEGLGRDETEIAITLRDGTRARRIANAERDEALEALDDEHYGRGAAGGRAPSFSSLRASPELATPAGPKPKSAPKQRPSKGGSVKKTPQRPSRSAGNPLKKLRLDNTTTFSRDARSEENEGARPPAVPRSSSPAESIFARLANATSEFLGSFNNERSREFREEPSPAPTESRQALRPASDPPTSPAATPEGWRELADQLKLSKNPPKNQCHTGDGSGWGQNGNGWDPRSRCCDCDGAGTQK